MKVSFTITLLFLFSINPLLPQDYYFRNIDREQGICNSFAYTINQDRNGYLWIGTGEGLCRYNGFGFERVPALDTLGSGLVKCSHRDKFGNLWFGFGDGVVIQYDGRNFRKLQTREYTVGNINRILSDADGNIFMMSQNNGLIKEMVGRRDSLIHVDLKNLVFTFHLSGWDILLGTSDGLFIYRQVGHSGPVELIAEVADLAGSRVQFIEKASTEDHFWVGTGEDVFLLRYSSRGRPELTNLTSGLGIGKMNVQSIFEDPSGELWVSTFGLGVLRFQLSTDLRVERTIRYNDANGLPSKNINQVFRDLEGNFWMASYGNGISLLAEQAFEFYDMPGLYPGDNILSLAAEEHGIWVGGEDGLSLVNSFSRDKYGFYGRKQGLPPDRITAVYHDANENTWAGTENSGIFLLTKGSVLFREFQRSENDLENNIRYITGNEQKVWIATRNGVFSVDIGSLEVSHYTTSQSLPHNDINHLFIGRDGNVWISTVSNTIYKIDPSGSVDVGIRVQTNLQGIVFQSFTQDIEGNLWGATRNSGVFCFAGDSAINLTRNEGLLSSYCYSILADPNGNIWVGHRTGFSRIRMNNLKITTYSTEFGILGDCNLNAIASDEQGRVLIGTTQGLVRFDPAREKYNSVAPFPNITSLLVSDVPADFTRDVILPYDLYKIRIDFIGLNYRNPQGVTYQYKLENYDLDWTTLSGQSWINYPRVADGRYQFMLRTCNDAGICNEEPLVLNLVIKKPFWKQTWFILTAIAAMITIFIVIVRIRERNQKKLQVYLETELAARTREVVEQKEELEIKNREITDSINYAQRIQASILPPVKLLADFFPGSFVFYQPRDIVSGDFYWFDKMNSNKFLIVCADSTGHGVPGAFMSMIGATLIKDYISRNEVDSPSHLLQKLDAEISGTLNQNADAERSNDGMDITVCEINLETLHFRFASAMRPIIISHKGEQLYIRGNRSSIGGEFFDSKTFMDQEFHLNKGDRIYMFSDGYPDQFGGPLGKKLKMVRLKELIDEMQDKSMDEQYESIRKAFFDWKGELPQVDDVLFMAIQV